MENSYRQIAIDATIREWQTAGDDRTEIELRPLATAAFDAYTDALDKAYELHIKVIFEQRISEGMDPLQAVAEACVTAYDSAAKIAKAAAQDALADPLEAS